MQVYAGELRQFLFEVGLQCLGLLGRFPHAHGSGQLGMETEMQGFVSLTLNQYIVQVPKEAVAGGRRVNTLDQAAGVCTRPDEDL
jgi:hypothetical protein